MEVFEFVEKYKEAFGTQVALPIAFSYSDTKLNKESEVPRCMIGTISRVRDGNPLILSRKNVKCIGSGLYTGFAPMNDNIPKYVSLTECYK